MSSGVSGSQPLGYRVSKTISYQVNFALSHLRIDGISLGLVSVEADDGEFLSIAYHVSFLFCAHSDASEENEATHSLDLTRVNLHDTNPSINKFLAQSIAKGAHGGFSGAVDAATGVWLATGDTTDVNNISSAAFRAGLEDGQHSLRHVDQTGHIGLEHDVDVVLRNLRCAGDWVESKAWLVSFS